MESNPHKLRHIHTIALTVIPRNYFYRKCGKSWGSIMENTLLKLLTGDFFLKTQNSLGHVPKAGTRTHDEFCDEKKSDRLKESSVTLLSWDAELDVNVLRHAVGFYANNAMQKTWLGKCRFPKTPPNLNFGKNAESWKNLPKLIIGENVHFLKKKFLSSYSGNRSSSSSTSWSRTF